jgi:hypothetical protein
MVEYRLNQYAAWIYWIFFFFCGSEIQVCRHHMGNTNEKFFSQKQTDLISNTMNQVMSDAGSCEPLV